MEVTTPKTMPEREYKPMSFYSSSQYWCNPTFLGKKPIGSCRQWTREELWDAHVASRISAVGWLSSAEGQDSQMRMIRNPQKQDLSDSIVRGCHYSLFPLLNAVVLIPCLYTWYDLKIRPETQWIELAGQEVFLFIL